MGKYSDIGWTNHTWNPWRGCKKFSQGCVHCYMFREMAKFGQDPTIITRAAPGSFNSPLNWKEPAKVFTCSWSDFFLKRADDWRDDAWDIIRRTPHLVYLILTKRVHNIRDRLPSDWPLPNVWLGITVENNKAAIQRATEFEMFNEVKRFVSYEPAIGDVDWTRFSYIDWLIAGGESGPEARVTNPDWIRSARDWAVQNNIPFFFKQWGEYAPTENGMVRVGRRVAGKTLDGREWLQVPKEIAFPETRKRDK